MTPNALDPMQFTISNARLDWELPLRCVSDAIMIFMKGKPSAQLCNQFGFAFSDISYIGTIPMRHDINYLLVVFIYGDLNALVPLCIHARASLLLC